MGIKKSVKARLKKEREDKVKEVNTVIRTAIKNFNFLDHLIVAGNPEETYCNIMDYRESVEEMLDSINKEMAEAKEKGEA